VRRLAGVAVGDARRCLKLLLDKRGFAGAAAGGVLRLLRWHLLPL